MARSRRPFLIRAIYDWACDHAQTPHLLVAADYEGCEVPGEHVEDGLAVAKVRLRPDCCCSCGRFESGYVKNRVGRGRTLGSLLGGPDESMVQPHQ